MEHVQTERIDEPLEGGEAFYLQDGALDGIEANDTETVDQEGVEDDEESVYMIQGVVCRKI
jgi:hypothetical protein